jgi:hypothetical protein
MAKGNSQKPANGSNLDFEAQLSPVGVAGFVIVNGSMSSDIILS